MWIIMACLSALFAAITAILAKTGIKGVDSNVGTAIRTIIILVFSWLMVFVKGLDINFSEISTQTLIFLVLSGIATGASWLFYFKALQIGDINKIVPIDKSSTILTVILALIILNETISILKGFGIVAIAVGTFMMIGRKKADEDKTYDKKSLIYALLSAVFASLTSILGKIGIENVDSTLGTAIRTIVVLIMAWGMVFVTGKASEVKKIDRKSLVFLCLSGITTGFSWLCYYDALKNGEASVVVPIDKLSILLTITFSVIFFKEKLTKLALIGLGLITAGTLMMISWG